MKILKMPDALQKKESLFVRFCKAYPSYDKEASNGYSQPVDINKNKKSFRMPYLGRKSRTAGA